MAKHLILLLFGAVSRVLRRTPLQRVRCFGKLSERLFGRVAQSHVVQIEGFSIELDRRDVNIARRIVLYGDYEGYLREVLLEHARPGSTVLDIGANVGLHTLRLSRRVDSGQVVAFEPDSANFALLKRNLERNGAKNVVAHRLALSDAPGRALLYQSSTNRRGLSLARGNVDDDTLPPAEVEVGVADDVLRSIAAPISLAKIDVEGAEAMVIRGMRGLLARNPELVLVFEFIPPFLVEFGDEPRALLEGLERDGFRLSIVDDKKRRLIQSNAASIMARCGAEPDLLNILAVPAVHRHAGRA